MKYRKLFDSKMSEMSAVLFGLAIFSLAVFISCSSTAQTEPKETIPPEYLNIITPPLIISNINNPMPLPDFIYVTSDYMENIQSRSKLSYWQGADRITTLPVPDGAGFSSASVIKTENGTVYTAGGYKDSSGIWIACYWKGTERVDLPVPEGANGAIRDIAIYNGEVYVLGLFWYGYIGDGEQVCYWKDNVRADIAGAAWAIAAENGTVYIAGMYTGEDNVRKPCYWHETDRIDLPVPDGAAGSTGVITIYNGSVYTAGSYIENGIGKSCYWQNTERVELSASGRIDAITVADGTVYIAGSYIVDLNWQGAASEVSWRRNNYSVFNAVTNNSLAYPVLSPPPIRWMICYWRGIERIDLSHVVYPHAPIRAIAAADGTVYNVAFTGGAYESGIYWENNVQYNLDTTGFGISVSAVFIDR